MQCDANHQRMHGKHDRSEKRVKYLDLQVCTDMQRAHICCTVKENGVPCMVCIPAVGCTGRI